MSTSVANERLPNPTTEERIKILHEEVTRRANPLHPPQTESTRTNPVLPRACDAFVQRTRHGTL